MGYTMKKHKITFPSEIHAQKDNYSQLIETIQPLFNMPNDTNFVLDFNQLKWIDANLLAIIGAAIEHRIKTNEITYLKDSINNKQADLWGRNGFGKYFNLNVKKRYDTTVDYKVFEADDAKKFGDYIDNNLLNKSGLPNLSHPLKKKISYNIQEIFGNAPLHGKCQKIISCGQYFHTAKKMAFTVVDCGSTITENVVEYFMLLHKPAPTYSIAWATVENNSTKRMINGKSGGMGLALLKEFIGLNNGHIQICSGNEFWEYTSNKESSSYIDSNFPGTIVNININMNDKKSYSLVAEQHNLTDLF